MFKKICIDCTETCCVVLSLLSDSLCLHMSCNGVVQSVLFNASTQGRVELITRVMWSTQVLLKLGFLTTENAKLKKALLKATRNLRWGIDQDDQTQQV